MTVDEIRKQFPYLESGKIYLNHAATGPWSRYVENNVQRFMEGRARGPIDMFPDTIRMIGEARSIV